MRSIPFIVLFLVSVSSLTHASMIVVPVAITYQGVTVRATLAVDTGATTTTIDRQLADRLGIPSQIDKGGLAEMADGRKVPYSTVPLDVTAGDMTRHVNVNIMEYAGQRNVDGWLGLNYLDSLTLTIDWKNKRLYWSE